MVTESAQGGGRINNFFDKALYMAQRLFLARIGAKGARETPTTAASGGRNAERHGVIGIVIVAHGGLAREYKAAVEHVVGRQDGIRAISIESDDDRDSKEQEICEAADSVDRGAGVVVVTDMFGGSPSNLSMRACCLENRKVIYGANLPLLVKLAKCRRKPFAQAVEASLAAGRRYIDSIDSRTKVSA